MSARRMAVLLARWTTQALLAGLFYCAWMAFAIPTALGANTPLRAALWVLASLMTAAGYAAGIWLCDRLGKREPGGFMRSYAWPLAGCALGAAVTYPFGPMLIVFGMFALDTIAVTARETRYRDAARTDAPP